MSGLYRSQVVMPDGRTVGEQVLPLIAESYKSGSAPRSLLALPAVGETVR